ncbi:hypothetical protein HDV00_001512 [Rhizophlyctis rosea]|nr:hypothetical protein HDV00_001512 [Rhizophlyctis rosea]
MPGRHISLVVTVIRHGDTDQTAHVPRILQGQSDNPMNAAGYKQARALAWRLKKHKFHRIYTSDLQRAQQTAQEIAKTHPNSPLTVDPRLREQNLGDLTGLDWPTAKQILKSEDRNFQDHVARSGEDPAFFTDRIVSFYADIIDKHLVQPHMRATGEFLDTPLNEKETVKRGSIMRRGSVFTPTANSSFGDRMMMSPMRTGFSTPTSGAFPSTPLSPAPFPRPQRSVAQHILIVTHGGVISALFKYLLDDLSFPLADTIFKRQTGFPKHTSVYRFEIARISTIGRDGDRDWEWEGCVTLMNDVGHLARLPVREVEEGNRQRAVHGAVNDAQGSGVVNEEEQGTEDVPAVRSGLTRSGTQGNLIDSPKMPRKRPFKLNGLSAFGQAGKMGSKVAKREEPQMPASRVKSLGW